jgi:antitoxin (DNA-binding transcriptional repressor) of toxin-antitoxin stability system
MKAISQRELRNASAAVMDAVERGASFRITRHGTVVAELRSVVGGGFVGSATRLQRARACGPARARAGRRGGVPLTTTVRCRCCPALRLVGGRRDRCRACGTPPTDRPHDRSDGSGPRSAALHAQHRGLRWASGRRRRHRRVSASPEVCSGLAPLAVSSAWWWHGVSGVTRRAPSRRRTEPTGSSSRTARAGCAATPTHAGRRRVRRAAWC